MGQQPADTIRLACDQGKSKPSRRPPSACSHSWPPCALVTLDAILDDAEGKGNGFNLRTVDLRVAYPRSRSHRIAHSPPVYAKAKTKTCTANSWAFRDFHRQVCEATDLPTATHFGVNARPLDARDG